METISLNIKELQEAVYGDSSDFSLIQSEITGTFRHGNENTAIIQRILDNKFFKVYYRDSVKDECDFESMNSSGTYSEVVKKEKTITIYE